MVIGAEIEICCALFPLDADEIFGLSKDHANERNRLTQFHQLQLSLRQPTLDRISY